MAKKLRHKIALIEDDPYILEMYRLKFELEGYHVKTATDGRSGLQLIQEFQPHLTLLDIMMPHKTGLEVLEDLRAHYTDNLPKVIVLTNMGDAEVRHRATSAGALECLVKAEVTPRQMVLMVRAILEPEITGD